MMCDGPHCIVHCRDFSLLSFGEEAVEDEEEVTRASSVSISSSCIITLSGDQLPFYSIS